MVPQDVWPAREMTKRMCCHQSRRCLQLNFNGMLSIHQKSAFSCWSGENFQAWGSWWQRKAGVLLPGEVLPLLLGWMKWEETGLAYRISLDHSCFRVHVAKGRVWRLWKVFWCCCISLHELDRDTWRTLPCWQLLSHFNWITLAPDQHHLQTPFPLLPGSLCQCRSTHPWQRHFSSTPGLLQVGSAPFGNFWAAFDYPWASWGKVQAPAELISAQKYPRKRSPSFSGSWTTSGCQF